MVFPRESSGGGERRRSGRNRDTPLKNASNYTFVDYASQAYSALALGFIVLFHNQTVPHWRWLAALMGWASWWCMG